MATSTQKQRTNGPSLADSSLLFGVGLVILSTAAYAVAGILPTLRRTMDLADHATALDVTSLQKTGELHLLAADNRIAFNAFLAAPARSGALEAIAASDQKLTETVSQLPSLSASAPKGQLSFPEAWSRYLEKRAAVQTDLLNRAPAAQPAPVTDPSESGYMAAQEALRRTELAQQAAMASHIREISRVLRLLARELIALTAILTAGLGLIWWFDRRAKQSERRLEKATDTLRLQEKSFQDVFDGAAVGMTLFKLDGTLTLVNRQAAGILGYEPEELIGTIAVDTMAPEHRDGHLRNLAATTGQQTSYVAERRVLRKDGVPAWVRNSVTLIQPQDAEAYLFAINEEITQQRESLARLEWLANYDLVTALPNRRCFEEKMTSMLEMQSAAGSSLALLYIEIDSFDFLKGTFGRAAADAVLAELASELHASALAGESIGRLDDFAFGMLMPSAAYDGTVVKRAEELLELFRGVPDSGAQQIPLSASIGIVYADHNLLKTNGRAVDGASEIDSATSTMVKFARAAMLEARTRGGDAVQVADPALQERALQRYRIETALLRGIQRDEFRVVFQPQFRLNDGMLVRFEALCRWDSAELGSIPPDRFIPIAEESGLMMDIGRRVMMDALRQARRWTDAGRKIGISVNVSPVQFMRPDFTGVLSDALEATGFPPALLELEITEGIFIRDLNLAVARIRDLQRLGVTVALDDFGTGYSSLSYLQRMPIDAVKLDRSFVSELSTHDSTLSMVRSVLSMADALDLRVVIEGVETREQLDILRDLGCEEAQGHFLGRPEEAESAYQRVMDSPRVITKALA